MAHAHLTGTLPDGRIGQERIWFIDWAQGQMLREGKDTYLQACSRSRAARRSHVRNVFSDREQSIWITLNDSPLYSVLQISASFSPIHQPLLKSASLQTYSSTYMLTCKPWRQKRGNVAERWFVLESHPAHSYQPLQKKKRKASENRFQLDCFSSSCELRKNPIINRCLKTLEKCNNCCWTALTRFLRYSKPQNHAT